MKIIIGLTGKAGSGKTTAGNYLEKKGFERMAFADKLKELAMHYYNLDREDVFVNKPAQVRTILQGTGMLIREQFGQDYFIQEIANRIAASKSDLICIDDIRLPEEAGFVKASGGMVILMQCPDGKVLLSKQQQCHATENTDVISCDVTIKAGYGDIGTIYRHIDLILERMFA